jgi:outer membrane protein
MKRFLKIISLFLLCPLFSGAQTGTMATSPLPHLAFTPLSDSTFYPADNSRSWTLQECISYALEHNISIRQQQLNVQLSEVDVRQSRGAVLPDLNGVASHTYQSGRTVDRFTNTFANTTVLSQNFYLSSSVVLFNGLRNYNTIRQYQYGLQSSEFQLAQIRNDIAISVSNAYLQVLYTQDQADLAQQQTGLTEAQVRRTENLVEAGTAARGTLLDLQAQLANEQVTLISAQNNVTLAYLNLTQLMNLDSLEGFTVARPDLPMPAADILSSTPGAIYQTALTSQPAIKKAESDFLSADRSVAVAKGAYSPTLTLQGSIGTGYSGLAKDVTGMSYNGYDTIAATTGGDFVISPNVTYSYATTPYGDQLSNNLNKTIGVQLTIPIFNRFQASSNVERAKIRRENARLGIELSEQQLNKNIQQAWADAKAAFEKYQASLKAVDAAAESFRYTEEKFNVGAVNSFDYNNSKNQLTRAQSNLIQAKYDYIFRLKVLDYYQGKPLTF